MAVFLIKDNIIINVVSVQTLEQALKLYSDLLVVERTSENGHMQIGDTYA